MWVSVLPENSVLIKTWRRNYQNGRKSERLSIGHLHQVWLKTGPADLHLETQETSHKQNKDIYIHNVPKSFHCHWSTWLKLQTVDSSSGANRWPLFYSLTGLIGVEGHKLGAGFDVVPLAGEGTGADIVDPLLELKTQIARVREQSRWRRNR